MSLDLTLQEFTVAALAGDGQGRCMAFDNGRPIRLAAALVPVPGPHGTPNGVHGAGAVAGRPNPRSGGTARPATG
jgi:hypothetical protein